MPDPVELKEGDTARAITDTLQLPAGTPLDLTGATVSMILKDRSTAELVTKTATVVSATAGTVRIYPDSDFNTPQRRFDWLWKVDYGGGSLLRIPTEGFFELKVSDNLE